MSTTIRIWLGLAALAALLSTGVLASLYVPIDLLRTPGRAGLFLAILVFQVLTAAVAFYTAAQVALRRYEVAFEARLRNQTQEMNRRIEEMKSLLERIDLAFRDRTEMLTRELTAAVRETLTPEADPESPRAARTEDPCP
jgi:hypothetical protein